MHSGQGQEPSTPRKLPDGYTESVRFAWERMLDPLPPGSGGPEPPMIPGMTPDLVALSEASAPRISRLAREVAGTLGFSDAYVLMQTRSFSGHLNAQALLTSSPFAVRLIGPVANLLSDGGLRAMLGHEFGHALAHRNPNRPASSSWNFTAPPRGLVESWSLASELTADRFALLACQDIEAAVHLELASATGDSPEAQGVVALDYLAECVVQVERRTVPLLQARGTYPSREFRLYAAWLFSQSDVYRGLVGAEPRGKDLATIDRALVDMCKEAAASHHEPAPPTPASAPVHPRPKATAPADPDAADVLRSLAWTAGQTVARLATRISGSTRSSLETDSLEPATVSEASDIDEDLASQLRRLEREAALDDPRGREADDLERRFRELEERELRKKGPR